MTFMLQGNNKHYAIETLIWVFETFQDSQLQLGKYLLLQGCWISESASPKCEIRASLHWNAGLYVVDVLNPKRYWEKRGTTEHFMSFNSKKESD